MFSPQEKSASVRDVPAPKEWPYGKPKIEIDYEVKTIPFPEGKYLREKHLATLTNIAHSHPVEILGEDGYGKSTMTEEIERFNRERGEKVLRVDVRMLLALGWTPEKLTDELIRKFEYPKTKVTLIVDNTDELWFREKLKGKTLAQLRQESSTHRLGNDAQRQLSALERKEEYLDWLIANKSNLALFITAHSDTTPAVRNYKDEQLRAKLIAGLNPHTTRLLYTPYTREEAKLLLEHLGIFNPDLIKIITKASDRMHYELKALACMRINGMEMSTYFRKANSIPGPMPEYIEDSYVKSFKKWLNLSREDLKHMAP